MPKRILNLAFKDVPLLLIFVDEKTFFQEYMEIESKTFFIICEEFFEWQK